MSASRAYPLRYGGGLFLCCVGAAFVLAVLTTFDRANVYFGWGGIIGTLGYFVTGPRVIARYGWPRLYQFLLLVGVIVLQFAVFSVMLKNPWFLSLPPYRQQLLVLVVVAVHFMLMRWSVGLWAVGLGAADLVLLAVAAVLSPPVPVVILGFGLLNILFGAIMAAPIFGKAPAPAGGDLRSK